MKKFQISGYMKIGSEGQKFTKEIEVDSKKLAELYTYCKLGSDHKVKRNDIKIDEIKELK